MNRDVNKLKKIFRNCGLNCGSETKGKAIDELYALSESGQLGSGGGSSYKNKVTFKGIVGTGYYQTTINFSELFNSEVSFPLSLYGGWQITEVIGNMSPNENGNYFPLQDYKVKINLEKIDVILKDYEIELHDASSGMYDNKEFEIVIEWN